MNHKILVIDDDDPLRETLCETLIDEGYEVVGVSNGRLGLDYLQGEVTPPSLIFLDLMMPVMNGWEFLEERVKAPQIAGIPVVVLTANGRAGSESLRADEVLAKPLTLVKLLETTKRYCPD